MTLILGMSKPEGIYLSVDYRVSKNGALVDDASVKFLTVHFPPEKTGPRALIAYTGVAFAPDATPVGDWLMQTMRGQTETFDASMQHLRSRLDRDFGGYLYRHRTPLIVNVLATERDWRFLGGFTNLKKDGRITRSFDYVMEQLTDPCVFANGSGTARAALVTPSTPSNDLAAATQECFRKYRGCLRGAPCQD